MTREEVLEMLLEVLDAPTECRIVIDTKLPRTSNPEKAVDLDDFDEDDTLTYLVDKSDGDNKVFDKWKITSYCDGWWEPSSSAKVADFIMHIATSCVARVYVESY